MSPLKHCRWFSESWQGEKLYFQWNPSLPLLLLLQHLAKLVLQKQASQSDCHHKLLWMLCFLRKKINLHTYFSWSQLITDRRVHQNDIDVVNWPASLENVNSIALYLLYYSQRKDSCLFKDSHISMQVIWDASIASDTHEQSSHSLLCIFQVPILPFSLFLLLSVVSITPPNK